MLVVEPDARLLLEVDPLPEEDRLLEDDALLDEPADRVLRLPPLEARLLEPRPEELRPDVLPPELRADEFRLDDPRFPELRADVPPELPRSDDRASELSSSPVPISFLATPTAAGTATPIAAPAAIFFLVDIPSSCVPSSCGFISSSLSPIQLTRPGRR